MEVRRRDQVRTDAPPALPPPPAPRLLPSAGPRPAEDWQKALGKVRIRPEAVEETAAVEPAKPSRWSKLLGLPKKLWKRLAGDRALKKMITWRIAASTDTAVIALFITKNAGHSAAIGGLEVVTKMALKYFHERFWARIDPEEKRLTARALSYRAIGAVDTFLLAWLVTGNPAAGLGLVGIEFFTKIVLHWAHDKAWQKLAPVREKAAEAPT